MYKKYLVLLLSMLLPIILVFLALFLIKPSVLGNFVPKANIALPIYSRAASIAQPDIHFQIKKPQKSDVLISVVMNHYDYFELCDWLFQILQYINMQNAIIDSYEHDIRRIND